MTTPAGGGTIHNVVVVAASDEVPESRADTLVIVLDPAWTPINNDRPDVLGVRSVLGPVVAQVDVVDEALQRVDDWAAEAGLPDRLVAEGVTYWYRLRETMWRWLHERLQWAYALERLELADPAITFHLPRDEDAIDDVASALGATVVRTEEDAESNGHAWSICSERTAAATAGAPVVGRAAQTVPSSGRTSPPMRVPFNLSAQRRLDCGSTCSTNASGAWRDRRPNGSWC